MDDDGAIEVEIEPTKKMEEIVNQSKAGWSWAEWIDADRTFRAEAALARVKEEIGV